MLVVDRYLQGLLDRHADMPAPGWWTYAGDVDPTLFGISLVTVDGQSYEAGDTRARFPIQSISKPLAFGLALDRHGPEFVAQHVDVEPTGVEFNAISLDPDTGRPSNPMVNAGAIAVSGMFDRLEQVMRGFGEFAGRELAVDEDLLRAELGANHRNRAIAHLLKNSGALPEDADPEAALRLYLAQCTAQVDCRDLAQIAATLANGGVNPVTEVRAAGYETVRGVLSVMTSCGMYDDAGAWLFTVGMPAKSGVAGSIICVLPGRFGLAVYSPPLDEHGNSIRGLAVCRDISDDMALHMIESGRRPPSPVRARFTVAERTSKRVRPPEAQAELMEAGAAVVAFELQGELLFSEAEFVTREVATLEGDPEFVIVDFRRVRYVLGPVADLFADLHAQLQAEGRTLLFSGIRRHPNVVERTIALPVFPELDLALEHCEARLLTEAEPRHVPLAEHDLLTGLPAGVLETLAALMDRRRYSAGDVVSREDELLLVISGELSVYLPDDDGEVRVGTLSAGMLLGELALMTDDRRTDEVRADTAVEAFALSRADLEGLDVDVQAVVYGNLIRILSSRAQAMRDELARATE